MHSKSLWSIKVVGSNYVSSTAGEGGDTSEVAVVLAQLRGAGIQRMRFNIVKELIRNGYRVDLVVGRRVGSLAGSVPEEARVYEVGAKGSWSLFFGLLGYLRTRKPSYILSSYDDINIMIIVANWLLGAPASILVSVHNTISEVKNEGGWWNRYKWRLMLLALPRVYRKAAAIVAVSRGVAADMNKSIGISMERIHVIYNPVITASFVADRGSASRKKIYPRQETPVVGYFGRLHPQKRVDVLIKAFAVVRQSADCGLLVVGEGEEKDRLRNLTGDLGFDSDVVFYGYEDDPYPLMRGCDVIVLPSAYEGLGNVLIEALACGVQVISTDCPHGPAEILEDGKWGQLVPVGDVGSLADAIRRSLDKQFWVEPDELVARGMQFSAAKTTEKYLAALGLPPQRCDSA